MPEPDHTFVASADDFRQRVLENSADGPEWPDGAAHRSLPDLFEILAGEHERVRRYRAKRVKCLSTGGQTT